MLFSLNKKDFGHNYTELGKGQRFVEGIASTVAYFSNTQGGGRFTPFVSRYAAEFIKECIDDPNKMSPRPNWPTRTDRWVEFSKQHGFGEYWKFKGEVQANIGIIYRGRHTQTIGIQRGIKVPRYNYSGKIVGEISVAAYAAFREWGTVKMDAAPLFQPAIQTFVQNNWPEMVPAIKKAIVQSTKDYKVSKKRTASSVEQVASKNVNSDFNSVKKILKGSGTISSNAKTILSDPVKKNIDDSSRMKKIIDELKGGKK